MEIPPVFYWWSTGPHISKEHDHIVIFPKKTTYSSTGDNFLSQPSTEGSVRWNLVPTYSPLDKEQLSWFQSVYSNQPRLSQCDREKTMAVVTRPPVALQAFTVQEATASDLPSRFQPTLTGSLEALNTFSEHASKVASVIHTVSPDQLITRTSTSGSDTSISRESSAPITKSSVTSGTNATTTTDGRPGEVRESQLHGRPTPVTGRHGVSTLQGPPAVSESASSHPRVSRENGHFVFQGHTLAITSTLTIKSGLAITRLALGTDSVGNTVLLGDSTTLSSPIMNMSIYAVPSTSEGVAAGTPSISSMSTAAPSSTAIKSAARGTRSLLTHLWMAVLLSCLTIFG